MMRELGSEWNEWLIFSIWYFNISKLFRKSGVLLGLIAISFRKTPAIDKRVFVHLDINRGCWITISWRKLQALRFWITAPWRQLKAVRDLKVSISFSVNCHIKKTYSFRSRNLWVLNSVCFELSTFYFIFPLLNVLSIYLLISDQIVLFFLWTCTIPPKGLCGWNVSGAYKITSKMLKPRIWQMASCCIFPKRNVHRNIL